jgi:hypothetical protein
MLHMQTYKHPFYKPLGLAFAACKMYSRIQLLLLVAVLQALAPRGLPAAPGQCPHLHLAYGDAAVIITTAYQHPCCKPPARRTQDVHLGDHAASGHPLAPACWPHGSGKIHYISTHLGSGRICTCLIMTTTAASNIFTTTYQHPF